MYGNDSMYFYSMWNQPSRRKCCVRYTAGKKAEVDADENDLGDEESKALVVFYSATGTTKGVAEMIAKAVNGNTFELTPAEPYTDDDLDWTNENSRVCKEHEQEDTRHVELTSTEVENFDSYDVVFIGYPIWWQSAAWVVDDFIKKNDFTGKTVIPFCTSSSSSLGESGTELAEMAGTGNWLEGERFTSSTTEDEVNDWVNRLSFTK